MDELKRLIEDLGRAFETFKAENDKRIKAIESKGYAPADLVEKVERVNQDISAILAMKKDLEKVKDTIAAGGFPGGGKQQIDEAKAKAQAAFEKWFRKGDASALSALNIQGSASSGDDTAGGFTVPEPTEGAIDRVLGTVSVMRRLASVMSISTDTYKKLVSKGGTTSGWVSEKESRSETSTPSLAEIAIAAKEIYAMPYATQTLLDDSAVDIAAWLANEVAIEFAEEEGDAFIDGDGVSKPKGIASYSMVANANYAWGKVGYITSGHATLINNADKLVDLVHALKAPYRNGASWLMNDTTFGKIRLLKDGEDNYLWRPGLEAGAPETLLGKPVEIDDNVADIGASAYPVFFGNFKRAYLIVDRQGIRVLRDPYSAKPYVAFYTTKRVGGGIVMYEAIKALKVSA